MLRRSFGALAPSSGNLRHIYELRLHDIIPGKYDAYYQLAMEMLPKRPGVGKCQGYWTCQMGALNQFVQIWQYDNLQHRYDCRKALENDQEWQRSFVKPGAQFLTRQSNQLLRLVYREGNASTMSYKYLMQISPEPEVELSGPSASLAATFQVVVGENEGKYVHIVKARKLDDVLPAQPVTGGSSKILGPARWSTTLGTLWR